MDRGGGQRERGRTLAHTPHERRRSCLRPGRVQRDERGRNLRVEGGGEQRGGERQSRACVRASSSPGGGGDVMMVKNRMGFKT